jgi:hypothetical protein
MKKFLMFLFLLTVANLMAKEQIINKSLSLSAEGISELNVECGAGFLKVEGSESMNQIEVEAEIIIEGIPEDETDAYLKKKMELTLTKRGSKARLISRFESGNGFFKSLISGINRQVINLTVRMPSNLALDLDDGSGFIEMKNIGNKVDITDGSGEMTIQNIGGDLEIDDGSGSTSIEYVKGNLDIEDGSGDLEVANVEGSVEIDDGSGSLVARKIKGDLFIDDGSGEIRVEYIGGDVRITDGSGSIYIESVDQDVTITEGGSGSVEISDVKGRVYREED